MKHAFVTYGLWVGGIALVMAVAGARKAGPDDPKIFRVAYVLGPSELAHEAAVRFGKLVDERSHGRIQVRVFPSGQLGNERVLIESLKLRSVDMVVSGLAIVGWYAPEYGAMEAPFVWRDYDHVESVWAGERGRELKRTMRARAGVALQSPWYRGPRYLTTTQRKIRHPDDLKGLKLRVPELEVYVKSWQVFGANITPLPFNDMFMALRLGVVEGQENPLATIYGNHLHEVQRYIMETRHLIGFYIPVTGPSFERRFDESEKALIREALDQATQWHNGELTARESDYRRKLIEGGVEFLEVDRKAFIDLAKERIPGQFARRWKSGLYEAIVQH